MIKTVYICDHCGKEYELGDGGIVGKHRVEEDKNLCGDCFIKYHFLVENQKRVRDKFFNEKGLPFICDPLNGEIIHPSDLRLLMAQETAQRVLQTLYDLCFVGADKINKYGTVVTAQEILDVAKDEGVKIGQ